MNNNYFVAEDVKIDKITYGFFSKKYSCSTKDYFSLNSGVRSVDNNKLIKTNIQIAKKKLGLENCELKFIKQTHSNRVEIIDNNNLNKTIDADGSITKNKKIALAIMTADCAPIFIFDSNCSFICGLHVGWKGCLNNIIKTAVKKIMRKQITDQNLIAIVGPCLSKESFEVQEKFKNTFIKKNLQYKNFFSKNLNQHGPNFDMRGLINFQLQNCLVDKISNIMIDTYSNENLFFSHRRSFHRNTLPTGRLINMIGFRDNT